MRGVGVGVATIAAWSDDLDRRDAEKAARKIGQRCGAMRVVK
jgi:hypothetical protein